MVTLVNLTGSLDDLIGTDFVDGSAKVWIEANAEVIIDATGNQLRLGDAVATIAAGSFTFTGLWATNSATNPTAFQYKVYVQYTPKRPTAGRGPKQIVTWDSGWFSLTATSDLADVAEEQYAPPSWQTTFTTAMQTYADGAAASATAAANSEAAAEAARDAAVDISNISTSDAVVEALVKNTGGAGPLTSAALSAAYVRGLSLETANGVDPTGASECGAAITAAITAAESRGVPVVSKQGAFYKTGSAITLLGDHDLSRAVFEYTGTSGVAFTVGDAAGTVLRRTIKLPYVIASAKTLAGWAQVAGTVGVRLNNVNESEIHVRDVIGFETGLQLYSDGSPGVAYNQIHLGHLSNNKRNLQFTSNAAGWTNQNDFFAGRLSHDGAEGSLVAGTRQLLIEGIGPFVPDGNNFYGTSVENVGVAEYLIDCNGWYNNFYGVRYEWAGAAGMQAAIFRAGAKENRLHGGYGVEDLVITREATAKNNDVLAPAVNQSLWLPASGMASASGAPTADRTGGVYSWILADAATDEVAGDVLIPKGWVAADVTVVWFSQNGAAGNVHLYSKAQSHVAGASVGFAGFAGNVAAAAGGAGVVVASKVATAYAVTPGPLHVSVLRDGTAGTDTSAGHAGVLGVRLDRVA